MTLRCWKDGSNYNLHCFLSWLVIITFRVWIPLQCSNDRNNQIKALASSLDINPHHRRIDCPLWLTSTKGVWKAFYKYSSSKLCHISKVFVCSLTSCICPKYIYKIIIISYICYLIKTIILLLHSHKVLSKCFGTSFTKSKPYCYIIMIFFFLQKVRFSYPLDSTIKNLKFLPTSIPALSRFFSLFFFLVVQSILLLHRQKSIHFLDIMHVHVQAQQ